MADLADIGIRVDASQLERLNQILDKVSANAERNEQDMVGVGRAVAQLNRITLPVVGTMSRFNNEMQRSTTGFSRLSQAIQQTGYQAGDFIVQVQSGTNAFVAAGQQLTQLAGLIYLVNAQWAVVAGTIASIAIPLATMWLGYISRTEEAKEVTDRFDESVKRLRENALDLQRTMTALKLGVSEDEVDIVVRLNSLLGQRAALENSIAQAANAPNQIARYQAQLDAVNEQIPILQNLLEKNRELLAAEKRINQEKEFQNTKNKAIESAIASILAKEKEAEAVAKRTAANARSLNAALADAKSTASGFVGVADNLASALARGAAAWGAMIMNPTGGSPEDFMRRYNESGSADAAARNNSTIMGKNGGSLAGGAGGIRNFPSGGGGGGGGENPIEQELETLRSYLMEADEIEKEEYQKRQDTLRAALDQRMLTLEEYNALEKELKIKHNEELAGIDALRYGNALAQAEFVFGELASAAQAGGQKYQKIYKAFAIGEALITGYKAAVSAWEKGMTAGGPGLAAAYTALSLAKTGGLIAGMRSGGSGSTSSSRGSVGRVQSTAQASPQTVYVSGLDPNALFTGEMISNLFENFYQENDNRGKVFVVAR